MNDGFYQKQIDRDLCIFGGWYHIMTKNLDRKPQKVHLNQQIKIGIASNIN